MMTILACKTSPLWEVTDMSCLVRWQARSERPMFALAKSRDNYDFINASKLRLLNHKLLSMQANPVCRAPAGQSQPARHFVRAVRTAQSAAFSQPWCRKRLGGCAAGSRLRAPMPADRLIPLDAPAAIGCKLIELPLPPTRALALKPSPKAKPASGPL